MIVRIAWELSVCSDLATGLPIPRYSGFFRRSFSFPDLIPNLFSHSKDILETRRLAGLQMCSACTPSSVSGHVIPRSFQVRGKAGVTQINLKLVRLKSSIPHFLSHHVTRQAGVFCTIRINSDPEERRKWRHDVQPSV
ncbi:hypothetical protein AVEN_1416-1 [Araneus ventricosus]|uniref:Uncharacterized protein n=1 Tax=Araneus ventricosus TaxID=182803 RepID=A0A4Y2SUD3_ARAVE|nr:hypothetical protein AVEN_1416-1 [Araneus ventricosus]